MVERTQQTGLEEFQGFARKIETVTGNFGPQIHIAIEPVDKALLKNSKTGMFQEWIRLPPKATETSVPDGSVLDMYLREIEAIFKDAKREQTVTGALKFLLDKKILYRKKKLGKKFEGKEAAEHWVPVALM